MGTEKNQKRYQFFQEHPTIKMLARFAIIALIQSVQLVFGNQVNQVIDVINVNGFVPLSVINVKQETEIKNVVDYIKSKVISETTYVEEAKNLVVASKEDELEPLLPFLINGKHQMSILFFVGQIDNLELFKDDFRSKLKDIEKAFYFYLVLESDGRLFWHYVLSFQRMHSPVIGPVSIGNDLVMKEAYDLRGMTIKSIGISSTPFNTINCDDKGKNCESGGYVSEVMIALAAKLNFTLEFHQEPNNNMGVYAVSGPNNISGTFDGVFGALLNTDEYQVSANLFNMVSDRLDMFDFVYLFTTHRMLAMMVRESDVDYGLFVRPFQFELWLAIGIFTFLILAIFFTTTLKGKKVERVNSRRAITTLGWFFLLLVSSFYCGALTMHFTSGTALPFQTINDVLKAHPEWTLKHLRNTHVQFFSNPDPDFAAYWNSIKNELEKYRFDTIKEAMEGLENDKTVIVTYRGIFQHYLKNNPGMMRNVKTFAHQKPAFAYITTSKDSPLAILMRQASYELGESGLHTGLYKKHFGENINRRFYTSLTDSLVTLSAGQVILIFLIMVTAALSVLCILGVEFFWRKFWKRRVKARRVNVSLDPAGRSEEVKTPQNKHFDCTISTSHQLSQCF